MADLNAIADELSGLTVMEAAELATLLEDKWGVSAAAPVVVAGAGGAAAEAPAEEKTEFDVILVSYGDKKIQVIKESAKRQRSASPKKARLSPVRTSTRRP